MQTTLLFFLLRGNCKSGRMSSSFILQPVLAKDYFMEALFDCKREEQIKPCINAMAHGKQIKVSRYRLSFQASGYKSYC